MSGLNTIEMVFNINTVILLEKNNSKSIYDFLISVFTSFFYI